MVQSTCFIGLQPSLEAPACRQDTRSFCKLRIYVAAYSNHTAGQASGSALAPTITLLCFLAYRLYTTDCRLTTSSSCLARCQTCSKVAASVTDLASLKPSLARRLTYLQHTDAKGGMWQLECDLQGETSRAPLRCRDCCGMQIS